MSENGEIYTAGKNFTLPPAVTAWTNSTSVRCSVLNNNQVDLFGQDFDIKVQAEVKFVSAVSAGGSVKFLPAV